MPNYEFESVNEKGVYTQLFFHSKEAPKIGQIITVNGIKWKRMASVPTAAINTKIDPFSEKEYIRNTGSKKGTVGDLIDYAAELSEKRKDKDGIDKIKEKFYDNYKEKYKNEHPEVKKQKAKDDLLKKGIVLGDLPKPKKTREARKKK